MLADQFESFLTANSECNISLGQFVLKLAELVLIGELDKPFISWIADPSIFCVFAISIVRNSLFIYYNIF